MQGVHGLVQTAAQAADNDELVLLLVCRAGRIRGGRGLEEAQARDVLAEVGRVLVRVVLDADALCEATSERTQREREKEGPSSRRTFAS